MLPHTVCKGFNSNINRKFLNSEKKLMASTKKEIKRETKFYTDITNTNNINGARLVRCLNCIVMNQKYPELYRMEQETSGSTYTCICKIKPGTKGKEFLYKDVLYQRIVSVKMQESLSSGNPFVLLYTYMDQSYKI